MMKIFFHTHVFLIVAVKINGEVPQYIQLVYKVKLLLANSLLHKYLFNPYSIKYILIFS
jgi:hypothetical protein